MNNDEKDQIDDLFDRSNWDPKRTGRLPTEPNQQAIPGTLGAAMEMAECRGSYRHREAGSANMPMAYASRVQPVNVCPLCDKNGMHTVDCPAAVLQLMVEDDMLYGRPKAPPVSDETYNEIKEMASRHKIAVIVGDVDHVPRRMADLVIALGARVNTEVMTMAMLKTRGPGDAALVLCDDAEYDFSELAIPMAPPELRDGRLTLRDLLGPGRCNRDTPPTETHNRSDTGRHGPYNSFHSKSKKGRS